MELKKRIQWMTRTAVFIALIIIAQVTTAQLGNKLVTGSMVNALLIIASMTANISSGLIVSIISPILAKILGIGPLWGIIPFIILGNMVLCLVWYFMNQRCHLQQMLTYILSLFIGATAKFLVLYLGIVRFAIPILLQIPEPKANVISAMFSVPQWITATIGGVIAMLVVPLLQKHMDS